MTVTTASADAITAPTFSVAAGTYYVPKTVEITNPNGSGKVYYTLDGEDPTAESTEYSEPIEITTTTTLKAVVVDGDKSSDITSATYTIGTPDDVDNIAAFLAKDDGSAVKFTNPVTAVYQNGAYLYIKDDSGVALVYGSTGQTYANGDVVPAGFIGTKSNHNGLVELAAAAGEGTYKASTDKVDPIAATESELGKIDTNNINQYVCFKNVSYDATNKNLTDDEGGELALYSTFSGVKLPAADGTFDVSGFVSIYGTTIQLYPTEFISRSTVDNIADFKAMGKDAIAKVNCPLTVVAVYKTSSSVTYYAQDESGEGVMIFGAIADLPEYEAQDIIPAGFTGTYTLYNGIPEIYNCSDLAESTEQGTIKANGLSVDELGVDQVCDVVELQSVEILDIDEKSFNIKQDDVTVAAYNKFGLEELKAYINVTIRGIVSLISTDDGYAVEILPIEIDYSKGTADEAEISDEDDIIISTGDGSIIVEGGDEIQIVTPDGRATTVKGSGDTPDKKRRIIQTENGIYIVVVDGEVVEKVYVE
ncbi:MAG: chitobiase/beta-hexosaminidase C-terminal domain-containing protein [Muribaculaceae bacterium]